MNLIDAIREYIKLIYTQCGNGMKVLLMDEETIGIVSLVYSQSELISKEIFLFDLISKPNRDVIRGMKCLCFIRPTDQNIHHLCTELAQPKYDSYYIYFSNVIEMEYIRKFAEHDEYEVVRNVMQLHADYYSVSPHLFTLNIPLCRQFGEWTANYQKRTCFGLFSILLSLNRSALIRYQESSPSCKSLAISLNHLMNRHSNLFKPNDKSNNDHSKKSLILIIDRKEDTVTPLLNQWTYQAMVHNLLTIKNNRVVLNNPDTPEIVLSSLNDEFYEKNMYLDFGEIGTNISNFMKFYERKHQQQEKVESIQDMKKFIQDFPEYKRLSGTVARHVNLVSELSNLVQKFSLLSVSELEQQLASDGDQQDINSKIKELLKLNLQKSTTTTTTTTSQIGDDDNVNISTDIEKGGKKEMKDILRQSDITNILSIYSLRYENENSQLNNFAQTLRARQLDERYMDVMKHIVSYGGKKSRQSDIFLKSFTVNRAKKIIKGLKGVENALLQHQPLITTIMDSIWRGKLSLKNYPFVTDNFSLSNTNFKPKEIIIFIVGGVTYEESLAVHRFNQNVDSSNCQVILGGNHIHNNESFYDEVLADSRK
ncbi:hypothetical protein SNEBB_009626 [Seison nebaliae]|nr:hypothetical protein SNEBB_009626 [Seison nebaliae]